MVITGDLRLTWDAAKGGADLSLTGALLDSGESLATAYIVSLFSDRLAELSDRIAPETPDGRPGDRRGWWGDTLLAGDHPGDHLGSRLWLLRRAKSDAKLPLIARGYILESVQWAIDDGVVAHNDAQCFFLDGDQSRLGAVLTAYRRDQSRAVALQFDWAWQQMGTG